MKRLLLVVWALCAHTLSYAQSAPTVEVDESGAQSVETMVQAVFAHVNLAAVPSGVLLEHGYSSIDPAPYQGTPNSAQPALLPTHWRQLYAGMQRGVLPAATPLPALSQVDTLVSQQGYRPTSSVIPLAVVRYAYNTIDTLSLRDNLFTVQGIQLYDVPGRSRSPYLHKTLFAASQPFEVVISGTHTFFPAPQLYFSNDSRVPQWYRLAYQRDGQLLQSDINQPWGTQNPYSGFADGGQDFEVITTVGYADGQTLQSRCLVKVLVENNGGVATLYAPAGNDTWAITASRSYNGRRPTTGTATIAYGCGNNNQLRKPLIIVEGFDPIQNEALGRGNDNYETFYEKITGQNRDLRDLLENGGYDLVYLNPRNGGDYIQNNAYLLQALLEEVNRVKAQNGSTEPNVILGFSMGGLVTRYALADMERNGKRHQTSKYITFDSPHQGANIPLGYQYMVRHLAGIRISGTSLADEAPALKAAVAMLNTPAARQLLRDQADDQLSLYEAFQTEYRALGNPVGDPGLPLRALAVSNGSQVSGGQQFTSSPDSPYMPDHQEMLRIQGNTRQLVNVVAYGAGVNPLHTAIVNTVLFASGVRGNVEFIVNGFPDMRRDRIYVGKIDQRVLWFIKTTNIARSVTVSGFPARDIAPGGYIDFATGAPINLNSIPLTRFGTTRFGFVPTVSALDIRSPENQDVFYNIVASNVVADGKTPFHNVTGPDRTLPPPAEENEFHTFFTAYNDRLLRAELLSDADITGNEALFFDGGDDLVTIPRRTDTYLNDLNKPDLAFAIEAYIRLDRRTDRSQTIFSNRRTVAGASQPEGVLFALYGPHLFVQLNGINYGLETVTSAASSGPNVMPTGNGAHHVAVTRDKSGALHFYIDGRETPYHNPLNPTFSTRSAYSGGNSFIGGEFPYIGGFSQGFSGMIGEVRVWNFERSAEDIRRQMTTKLTAPQNGLIAYYDMLNPAGSQQVSDLSAVTASQKELSTGYLGTSGWAQADDPIWKTRCELTSTVMGNFIVGPTEPGVMLPDTLGQAAKQPQGKPKNVAGLSVSPNPASQRAMLHFEQKVAGTISVRIVDMMGLEHALPLRDKQLQVGSQQVLLPVQDLKPGIYMVVVETAGGPERVRLQVE